MGEFKPLTQSELELDIPTGNLPMTQKLNTT